MKKAFLTNAAPKNASQDVTSSCDRGKGLSQEDERELISPTAIRSVPNDSGILDT